MIAVSGIKGVSGNQYIDGLLTGLYWTVTPITYYYPQTYDMYAPPASPTAPFQPNVATFKPFTPVMQVAVDKQFDQS